MSKIKVDIDTEKKTINISKDGEDITDIEYLNVYSENSMMGFSCNICTKTVEEDGMTEYRHLSAKDMFKILANYGKS